MGTKEDVAFRVQMVKQQTQHLLRAFTSQLRVRTTDLFIENDFLDQEEYTKFCTTFRGELLTSMGIISSIDPVVSMQHLQWIASQHVASPNNVSLYTVLSRSFESCIPRFNFDKKRAPTAILSAGQTIVRALVDLTKRTISTTTFDPRRPNCYIKCLGSFKTHFGQDVFRPLLLPLVGFLLDCLSKSCPSESVLKEWRSMRRTIGALLISVSRKHESLFRPSFNDLCKRVAQLTRLSIFNAEERGYMYQTLTHLEQRPEFLSQILQAPLSDWRCDIFVSATKSAQALANFVFQDSSRNVKLPTMDTSLPVAATSKVTLEATWRIVHHIHVFSSVSKACEKNRNSSTAIWNAVSSNIVNLLRTLHSISNPNVTMKHEIRQYLQMISPENTAAALGISPSDARMKIMQSKALPRETAISRVMSKLHECVYNCMSLYACQMQSSNAEISRIVFETAIHSTEYMSSFRLRDLMIHFVEPVLLSHHHQQHHNNNCIASQIAIPLLRTITTRCLSLFESRWRSTNKSGGEGTSKNTIISSVRMNKKEDVESLNEAADSNLEFVFYGLIGKLVSESSRRKKKSTPCSFCVQCDKIMFAQADTANMILRSLCSAIECAKTKTLDRVVIIVTKLLPRLLERRNLDRFVGELLFKSVSYCLIWRPSNSDTIQWQLVSILRDIYVALVLKEQRCVAPQVMLARLFGQNGERKVQEMNARLRAEKIVKKQRIVMKNFISETTEASRMRKERENLKVTTIGMERSILSDVHSKVQNLKEQLQVPESEVAAKRRAARQEAEVAGEVNVSGLFGGDSSENF